METSSRQIPQSPRPRVLGLLAGIGAGKTTVAGLLARRGWTIIDADRIARAVLEDGYLQTRILEVFGPGVQGKDGRVDREALAKRVFRDREARRRLEVLCHPEIQRRILEELDQALAEGHRVVLDVPLLLEKGMASRCDKLLFIEAPAPIRRSRANARGIPPEDWAAREAAQCPLEEKKGRADAVVDNSGDLARTEISLETALARLGLES